MLDLGSNRGQGAPKAKKVLRVSRIGDEVNVYEEVRPADGPGTATANSTTDWAWRRIPMVSLWRSRRMTSSTKAT